MRSKEVLQLLKVSRVTLSSYVRNGCIKVTKTANGYYDYDDHSVYSFLGRSKRFNVIYARVSTYKQKGGLDRQINKLENYCDNNDISFKKVFSDISSGINFDRKNFSKLLNLVFENKIDTVYITYKDRLSRLSYLTIESIFNKFGTKIVPIYQKDSVNYDELFDEISSLMHHFSTKKYSQRKNP